ncbi:MAG: redoxin domain-containing protein, partial [Alphaproteobacteria bacterium]|nr:redoxin domain-containing protein [Alphaproteobacteria bacterium]
MNEILLTSQILLWLGFIGVIAVMAALLRQIGVLFERIAPAGALSMNARLKVGDKAPEFSIDSLAGGAIDIGASFKAKGNTLLFFLSTDCPVCKELLPALRSFERSEKSLERIIYVGSAQETGHEVLAERYKLLKGAYLISDQIGMAFAVSKLPYAVLINKGGDIAAFGLVNNREHLESLIEAEHEKVASLQDY